MGIGMNRLNVMILGDFNLRTSAAAPYNSMPHCVALSPSDKSAYFSSPQSSSVTEQSPSIRSFVTSILDLSMFSLGGPVPERTFRQYVKANRKQRGGERFVRVRVVRVRPSASRVVCRALCWFCSAANPSSLAQSPPSSSNEWPQVSCLSPCAPGQDTVGGQQMIVIDRDFNCL